MFGFFNSRLRNALIALTFTAQILLAVYVVFCSLHPPIRQFAGSITGEQEPGQQGGDILSNMHKDMLLNDSEINACDWKVRPEFFHYLALRQRKDLKRLVLGGSCDDRVISYLKGYHLNHLALRRTHVTRAGLQNVLTMESLQGLEITDLPLLREDLKKIVNLKQLRMLRCDRCGLTDESLRILGGHEFRFLALAGNQAITDAGAACLAHQPVDTMDLNDSSVSDQIGPMLEEMIKLKIVALRNSHVTDKILPYVAVLPELIALDLRGTAITDNGLNKFDPAATLKELKVAGCLKLSAQAISDFQARRPDLTVFR